MQNELKAALDAWQINKDYKRDAIPSVWAYHQAWCKENVGRTHYIAEIEKYINERESLPPELQDQLGTEVYLANAQWKRAHDARQGELMTQEGYIPLTPDMEYRGAALLRASKDIDFMRVALSSEGKFITSGRGTPFFIPKGRRTRGYDVYSIKGYYKPV